MGRHQGLDRWTLEQAWGPEVRSHRSGGMEPVGPFLRASIQSCSLVSSGFASGLATVVEGIAFSWKLLRTSTGLCFSSIMSEG